MVTRRAFLKMASAASLGLLVSSLPKFKMDALAFYQSSGVRKFVSPLRGVFPLDPNGIPVGIPDGKIGVGGATHYSLDISQYQDTLHPDLGGPTTLWGYQPRNILGGSPPQRHLGGIFVAQKGQPVQITFTNKLPNQHILPVDDTIMGVAGNRVNRTSVHLHGGLVPWTSDGGPFSWFDDVGGYGSSVADANHNFFKILNPNLQPGQAEYYYPNNQSARMMWYHDHAVGITRLNAYAGIASAYIIRDAFEGNLRNWGLPDFIENGGREIPIVVQDKIFVGPKIKKSDPTWKGLSSPGSLWYPHVYEPDRWELNPGGAALPDPSCVPEMFGDTMLANGTVFPKGMVEARLYRLRILNACQARFLNLQLYVADGSADGITLDPNTLTPTNAKGPDFLVIGTEGGFLSSPVRVPSNIPFNPNTMGGSLITAPAERWDILVDFKGYEGKSLILYTDAPAPFPMGDPINDYFPGNPNNPTISTPGFGPDTRQILRLDVVPASGKRDMPSYINESTQLKLGIDPSLVGRWSTDPIKPPKVVTRELTLNETFDEYGRLIQMLGTNEPGMMGDFSRMYVDPATETPHNGATEVWRIANLTGDTHPIHFHLANVQLLSRQPFDAANYNGHPTYTGPARGPELLELGWKETVKMNPGEETTVIMRFDLPSVPFPVPASLRTGGHEYVWHCHILDHEEHDMMRPLIVS